MPGIKEFMLKTPSKCPELAKLRTEMEQLVSSNEQQFSNLNSHKKKIMIIFIINIAISLPNERVLVQTKCEESFSITADFCQQKYYFFPLTTIPACKICMRFKRNALLNAKM